MNISKAEYINSRLLPVYLLVLCAVLAACKTSSTPRREVGRAIYFWKSVFRPSEFEKNTLARLGVKTIYVKYFDVDWDSDKKIAYPVAVLRVTDKDYFSSKQIIPVVFITNQCLHQIDSSQCPGLADKILKLVKSIGSTGAVLQGSEIQVDCDWTEATKSKYFLLLRTLHELEPGILFSATIRLYQVKFAAKTGIPPVTRGMLMCYNMGNLRSPTAKNSVLDNEELKKYAVNLDKYPLPLDVAFPIFDWAVLLRNAVYSGLIENLPAAALNSPVFSKKEDTYEVLGDTTVTGYVLKKGDLLRMESSKYEDLKSAINIIDSKLPAGSLRVSLFHLDSSTLKKYSLYELENLYNGLR